MLPVLFQYGDTALYTYTTFFSLAVLVGSIYWIHLSRKLLGLQIDSAINACLIMVFSGLLGAKALFILTNWSRYENGTFDLWNPASGGVVFYGGAIAGTLALLIWSLKNKLPLKKIFNMSAAPLCLAHIIGRMGCLTHGCCHGKSCPIGWMSITYTDPRSIARPLNSPLYPTQAMEILGLILLFFILKWELKKRALEGQSLRFYLMGYGILRFVIEFFRGDSLRGGAYGLSTSQIISILLIIFALFLDWRGDKGHNSPHENRS